MADFLPPDSLITPSRQENLGTILNAIRQPTTIALVASLGVHGLFLAGLPFLSSVQSKQPKSEETVQLIELTPAEQSRLPSSGLSQPFLSPMVPPRTTAAPSAPTTPNQTAAADAPLYDFPMVPPPPVVNYPPELDNPAPVQREQVTFQDIPALKPSKPVNKSETTKPTTSEPAAAAQNEAEPPAAPSAEDLKSDDLSRSGRSRLTAEEVFRLQQQAKQEQAAAQQQAYLQDMYGTFNAGAASLEAYQKNMESLTSSAKNLPERVDWQLPDDEEKQQLAADVAKLYPTEACPFKLKATVVQVAAIVQPDGKLLGDKPYLVLSSGYKGLDQVALEYITKKQFKPEKDVQFLLFKLPFPAAETACPPVATESKPPS
ncbi:hypothetical protein [Pantanalinema sp. GBBB05]|uniref:hypothetical protein n=1 Tax=Pantanalinema sp. GBBB05 TaxID=2604139 RepID=UPI001D458429|nr:hypothetical protein [Pantanalinema sp. GBBB05]